MLFPIRVLEPNDAFAVHNDDVQTFVGIHVNQPDGIAYVQASREFLSLEGKFARGQQRWRKDR